MPRKKKQKVYFGEQQENAVKLYLSTDSELEKNKIFNEYLREPLTIMAESIIRRYKLYRKDTEFDDILADTLSFLMTKINKFDHNKNHKAYSYFGTICKHYLMGIIQKDVKHVNRNVSYDDISSDVEDNIELSYTIDDYEIDYKDVINKLVESLEDTMSNERLNENEIKLGNSLIHIFKNYESTFQIGDGNKFNKNLILFSIREMTNLSTKEIRVSIRKYKKIYNMVIGNFIT